MKTIGLLFCTLFFGGIALAQNEDDALRYSQTYFGGTARNMGMAGAMTAIGGDFSTATQNPAGLGRIMKTNFSATLNLESLAAQSDFYGSSERSTGVNLNFSNLSYVKAYKLNPKEWNNWCGVQLGMGVTRINSFNQKMAYGGLSDSSILHSFILDANGTPDSVLYNSQPFGAGLALDIYGIDPLDGNQYTTRFIAGKAKHNRSLAREGGMSEYSFTLSANYANRLYIGGAVNATKVNYEERMKHSEVFSDTANWLNSINYTGKLKTEGWGYNARAGLIYFPLEWLSVGISAQLPTTYRLSDSWTNNMTAETNDGSKFVDADNVPTGSYDYRLKTPFRGNLSVGAIHRKIGAIGFEVEFVDYTTAVLSSRKNSKSPYSFVNENFQIDNIYKNALNFKGGVELKLDPRFYLRGGFAYYDSPFKEKVTGAQSSTLFYTGGVGYNKGDFYLDFATVLKSRSDTYYAYNPELKGSMSAFDFKNSQFMLTFGLRLK